MNGAQPCSRRFDDNARYSVLAAKPVWASEKSHSLNANSESAFAKTPSLEVDSPFHTLSVSFQGVTSRFHGEDSPFQTEFSSFQNEPLPFHEVLEGTHAAPVLFLERRVSRSIRKEL